MMLRLIIITIILTLSHGVYRFQSSNYPGHFLRHRSFKFHLDKESDHDRLFIPDTSFNHKPPINGRAGFISLESQNYPGHYLYHRNFRITLEIPENSQGGKDCASWKLVPAIDGSGRPNFYSFQSSNFPDHYIRHERFEAKLHKYSKDKPYLDGMYL